MKIEYKFIFPDKNEKHFEINLKEPRFDLVCDNKNVMLPEWTHLGYNKCENCSLDVKKHQNCPIAASLFHVVEYFKTLISHHKVDVEIMTESRIYKKHTTIQNALSSLVGIYMVTSGCPVDKLRPMVGTHLPFATIDETAYRVVSMYLLAQYFVKRHGGEPDWELKDLSVLYDDINIVNVSFRDRILNIQVGDCELNALVRLDCYGQFTSMLLESGLEEIGKSFFSYFE